MAQYLSSEPFERLAKVIFGPLLLTDSGNKYLMVIITILLDLEVKTVAEAFLRNVIVKHRITHNTPLQPQSHGLAEIHHGTIC